MSDAPPTEEQLAFGRKILALVEQGIIPMELLETASARGAKLMLITERFADGSTKYTAEVMDSIN